MVIKYSFYFKKTSFSKNACEQREYTFFNPAAGFVPKGRKFLAESPKKIGFIFFSQESSFLEIILSTRSMRLSERCSESFAEVRKFFATRPKKVVFFFLKKIIFQIVPLHMQNAVLTTLPKGFYRIFQLFPLKAQRRLIVFFQKNVLSSKYSPGHVACCFVNPDLNFDPKKTSIFCLKP